LAPRRTARAPASRAVRPDAVLVFGDAVFLVTLFASVVDLRAKSRRTRAGRTDFGPRPEGYLGPSTCVQQLAALRK
jgi:hypothetical protein